MFSFRYPVLDHLYARRAVDPAPVTEAGAVTTGALVLRIARLEVIRVGEHEGTTVEVVDVVVIREDEPCIWVRQIVREMRAETLTRHLVDVVVVAAREILALEDLVDRPVVSDGVDDQLRDEHSREAALILQVVEVLQTSLEGGKREVGSNSRLVRLGDSTDGDVGVDQRLTSNEAVHGVREGVVVR